MKEALKEEEINKGNLTYISLLKELSEYGYTENNFLSINELTLFFDMKSPNKKFNIDLLLKLFKFLDINEFSTIKISKFIPKFVLFYENIIKNKEELNEEYIKEKKIMDNINNMIEKFKDEKLNEEGFSEKAKLSGEIIDINLYFNLSGIKEIIIKIIYGGKIQEIIHPINPNQQENDNNNKSFEFKASSAKDKLEFILISKDIFGNIKEIGSKIYSSEELDFQESILVQLEYPLNGNEEHIAAIIKARIGLKKSEIGYYESLKRNEEIKLKKLMSDLELAEKNMKELEYIYSKEKKEEKDNIKTINNNNKGLSKKIFHFPEKKYIIEFNNERNEKFFENNLKIPSNNKNKKK